MSLRFYLTALIVLAAQTGFSQKYSHADSLRGNIDSPGRNWWDVKSYDLSVRFDEVNKFIWGGNRIHFVAASLPAPSQSSAGVISRTMQIDLQEPLVVDSMLLDGKQISFEKDGNAYFVSYSQTSGDPLEHELVVFYYGKPRTAVNPPWDGGVIWKKDANNNPWITVACQGVGASVWYPCKDSQADEPESATMHFTCAENLVCVSNGRFLGKKTTGNKLATYSWHVSSPINNYCIIPYIGDYVNIHEHYPGEKGMLELDYWVLRGNEEKAKEHFTDVPKTMEALEYWFGPYPFYEDGYKLIEAPHLGMEHQSAVAYGNKFKKGYSGTDLSGTGVGMKWDYIIVHETGHEWFGNNITTKDIADMWVHEGFTDYSETLFTEYWFGKEDASRYIKGLRRNIMNDKPVIGDYGVNSEGSGDMYYKGANMIHTIRSLVHNDTLFRGMLRGLNETFYHQIVTTEQVEKYMSDYLKMDLSKVFDQYLREKDPPTLELKYKKNQLKYRWVNSVKGFDMPVHFEGLPVLMKASEKWNSVPYTKSVNQQGEETVIYPVVDPNLYIKKKGNAPK